MLEKDCLERMERELLEEQLQEAHACRIIAWPWEEEYGYAA